MMNISSKLLGFFLQFFKAEKYGCIIFRHEFLLHVDFHLNNHTYFRVYGFLHHSDATMLILKSSKIISDIEIKCDDKDNNVTVWY